MLHCCIDVDITSKLLASDYCVIFLELWVMRYLKKTEPQEHILNLNNKKWSNPEIRQILHKEVMRNINCNSYFGYSDISNIHKSHKSCTSITSLAQVCTSLNTKIGTKSAWDATNTLQGWLPKTRPSFSMIMKCPNGSLHQTPKENSEVFCDHFWALYGRQPHFNKSVLHDLLQHPVFEECDHLPTDKVIIDATCKLKVIIKWAEPFKCVFFSFQRYSDIRETTLL